jgi:tetratricopeptide (TPR) repeat protein
MQLKQRFSIFNPKYIPLTYWQVFAVLVITATLYIRVFSNHLTNWDDELYILNNPYIKQLSFDSLKNIFTTYYAGNYHPLTLTSLALDYKLGGTQPWIYQLTSLTFHLLNTLLVFIFIKKLLSLLFEASKKHTLIPFITALLFGIHTIQVESVAWMSEQKNVLYTFFFLASLIIYLNYLSSKLYRTLTLSLVLFTMSLLAKGMAVPLSACIICIDYYAGRNLLSKKVIWEKVPYLALSLIFGAITIKAQHTGGAIDDENTLSLFNQIAVAGYGFVQYLVKLCMPFHLSAFYPYPPKTGALLPYEYYICMGISFLLLVMVWKLFRSNRVIVFSSLFFIANISIVIQLLPVGDAIMADRYAYVPAIGVFFIAGYYCNELWNRGSIFQKIITAILIVYCSMLCIKTYQRVGVWKDSLTLWNNSLEHHAVNNDRAHQNLGNVYFDRGKYNDALEHYNKILQIRPANKKSFSKAYIGKARIKQAQGDAIGAMNDFNTSLSLMQSYDAYLDRAVLKIEIGDMTGALADLDNASSLDPFGTGPYINKGGIYYQMGNYQDALKNFDQVHRLDPQNSKAYIGKGQVKQAMNDMQGAMVDFDKALSIDQTYEGYLNRAVLKIEMKDFAGAQADLDMAAQKDPLSAEVYINKGIIGLNSGNSANALIDFNKAVEMSPNNFLVYLYRAIAKYAFADYQGAIADLNISIQIRPNAEALCYRGFANKQLNRKSQACADFSQSAAMGNTVAAEELEKMYK